jgi:hypothetical protein
LFKLIKDIDDKLKLKYFWGQFLTKLHLMDYSLLLGVHECGRGEAEAEAARQREAEAESDADTDTDTDTDNRHHGDRWADILT